MIYLDFIGKKSKQVTEESNLDLSSRFLHSYLFLATNTDLGSIEPVESFRYNISIITIEFLPIPKSICASLNIFRIQPLFGSCKRCFDVFEESDVDFFTRSERPHLFRRNCMKLVKFE